MIKQIYSPFKVSKSVWILFFMVILAQSVKAGSFADTTKKRLLAAASAKDNAGVITLEPNVVFPDVLTGNEKEALLYIEKFSENRRAYLIRTYTRSKKYFPKATAILKKHNLPQELKVLLALESAFNGNAVSKAGAVGYWQIMDEVAKEYGLKYVAQQKKEEKKKTEKKKSEKTTPVAKTTTKKTPTPKDERKNFNKSTYAAARYLKDRSRNLDNNLLLMVASYNCGVGNVWNAMKKTGKTDPDFWDIKAYLPAETQAYVMNFITLNVVFHNYEKFTDNTLLFTPTKVKIENVEGKATAETTSLND
ncbi:MAG: lytic transglycosylase domain-containing protein [Chitinophagaceae bacterium]|nr:lytic transglycosylase domain-containing protein [Chitinophagaceae bacterium]